MASKLNINRNVQDPFYRYKMPRIIAKVEGKGNGIKTVIANMTEIAKALSRPPTYPTKYFGCELGAQTNFDLKNDRYIVNGEHDANKLQDILDGFIKKFVLCPACDNPETTLTLSKRQSIHGKCKACGNSFIIDPKQKLSTFILKNPPTSETNETPDNKEKRDSGSPTEDAEEETTNTSIKVKAKKSETENENDEDWASEAEDENQKLSVRVGKLVIDKDLDKSLEDRLDMLHQYFLKAVQDGSIQDSKKMMNEAERLELETKAPLLLADVLFDTDVINQIKKYRTLLLRFCLNDKKAQRHLLGGIEQQIYAKKEALFQKTAHIIKTLYDEDICNEEVLLAWGDKASGKYVKKDFSKDLIKMAQPVLTWLKEAEEDSKSESEENQDTEIAFDDRSHNTCLSNGTKYTTNNGNNTNNDEVKGENEEEIDIDDI